MGYLGDSLRALALTLKSAFRPPVTVHYPAQKRQRAERYRTSFALLHDAEGDEACVGCLQCEKVCPSQVITVVAEKKESPFTKKRRGYAKDFTLDLNACIYCELCVQVCPTDAIVMTRQPETPAYCREDLVLTMDKLYANEKDKPLTWGKASNLMEMQDPKRGQPPPEKPAAKEKPAAAEKAPAEEKAPAVEAKPAVETKPAVEAKPAAEAKPAVEAKPAAEAKPATETAPSEEKPSE